MDVLVNPSYLTVFGFNIVYIDGEYYKVDKFNPSTPQTQRHSLEGAFNISSFIQNSANFIDNVDVLKTMFAKHLEKQIKERLDFSGDTPWKAWYPV